MGLLSSARSLKIKVFFPRESSAFRPKCGQNRWVSNLLHFYVLTVLCLLWWTIEKDGQFYVLKARGAPAFTTAGLVFVSLIGEPDIDVKWKITAVPQSGPNVFLWEFFGYQSRVILFYFLSIESPTKFGGWVLPESEPETQVRGYRLFFTFHQRLDNALKKK